MKRMIMTLLVLPLMLTAAPVLGQVVGVSTPDAYMTSVEVMPDAGPAAKADVVVADVAADATAKAGPVVPPVKQPETVAEALQDVGLLVEAAKNGNWILFTGLLIMLLIFLLDRVVKLKDRLPADAIPWVAAALGIVGSIAAQLTTGIPWGQALLQGFTAGVASVGLWELLFKHFMVKKEVPVVDAT